MTGVEAVSNAAQAVREPVVKIAQRTLAATVGLLIVMLAASVPGQAGYQSLLSRLTRAVAGHHGIFFFITAGRNDDNVKRFQPL